MNQETEKTKNHIDRKTLLKQCDMLIESGDIGNAKKILLELVQDCNESQELESILKYTNTIKALEIIELSFQKKPNKTREYAQALEQEIKTLGSSQEIEIENLLGKFSL
jgi:hypothetical protein